MQTKIVVENLKCGGCANTISNALSKIEGVEKVDIDVPTSTLDITVKESVSKEAITEKLAKLGYPEMGTGNSISQKAKSYVSCAIGRIK